VLTWVIVLGLAIVFFRHVDVIHILSLGDVFSEPLGQPELDEFVVSLLYSTDYQLTNLAVVDDFNLKD